MSAAASGPRTRSIPKSWRSRRRPCCFGIRGSGWGACDQPQDRQGARPSNTTDPARPRRRGDRVRRCELFGWSPSRHHIHETESRNTPARLPSSCCCKVLRSTGPTSIRHSD
jgi:hypothetical protein